MAFKLTEEQHQKILEAIKTNPDYETGEKRGDPYSSMSGMEYQLQQCEAQVDENGRSFKNIFYFNISRPKELIEKERESGSPHPEMSFSIDKMVVYDDESN